jgi:diaminopimelate decarboxylase
MSSKALQAALKNYQVLDNRLVVAGRPISEWAEEYGTPLYLYDASVIRSKISLFRKHLPDQVELYYAIKANPNPEIIKTIIPLVDGFDVASIGELDRAISVGANPDTISFAGPGKRPEELSRAIEAGIGSLNIESERELELIVEAGKRLGKIPKISIRINPSFELHGSGMKMGGSAKQFGIDEERVPAVLGSLDALPVNFRGFHIFAGSQNLNAEAICASLENSLDLALRLLGSRAAETAVLNLGGGFGIPYFENDEPLDLRKVGDFFEKLLWVYRPHFPKARFVIELGRFLVGEAGLYMTKVLYKKVSRGKTFAITDGGMNHHLAASGNFGQVLRKNYPIVNGNTVFSENSSSVELVGPLCTPLDLLGAKAQLGMVQEGDIIVIMNSGAYGYTASPLFFLGHPWPREFLVYPKRPI